MPDPDPDPDLKKISGYRFLTYTTVFLFKSKPQIFRVTDQDPVLKENLGYGYNNNFRIRNHNVYYCIIN